MKFKSFFTLAWVNNLLFTGGFFYCLVFLRWVIGCGWLEYRIQHRNSFGEKWFMEIGAEIQKVFCFCKRLICGNISLRVKCKWKKAYAVCTFFFSGRCESVVWNATRLVRFTRNDGERLYHVKGQVKGLVTTTCDNFRPSRWQVFPLCFNLPSLG